MPKKRKNSHSIENQVLILLEQVSPKPLRLGEIAEQLNISHGSKEYKMLIAALQKLQEQGVITKSRKRRYRIADEFEHTVIGTLQVFGYEGVVRTDHPRFPTIHIERHLLNTALHGDTVRVRITAIAPTKKVYGEVVEIVERKQTRFTCTIEQQDQFYFAIPDDEHIHVDFLIHPTNLKGAQPKDKVLVELVEWTDPFKTPIARVLEVLGRAGITKIEFDSIVKEYNLPESFPTAVLKEAERVAHEPTEEEIARREDFRSLPTITIDPTDAKDFDDALSIEILPNGNYRLYVHIADVSYYVRENSELDREAFRRGTSVYLVDRVIPMLPEILSNNICSLMPNKDRLAYTCIMEITPRGIVKNYAIVESVINSNVRFTYEEVQDIIDRKATHEFEELILTLHQLAQTLRNRRYLKGGIDFENPELRFIIDENYEPVNVVIKKRTDATSLVEECMLIANKTIAEHIRRISPGKGKGKKTLPFLYRIHDVPDPQKLRNSIEILHSFGLQTPSGKLSSRDINQMLLAIDHLPEKFIFHQLLLRAMAKAVYSEYNIGHYGLGFSEYTHFTSPIRRYPDLVVHRLLKRYAREIPDASEWDELNEKLGIIADHSSAQEQLAVEAERASIKLAQTLLARKYIGETFNATVTGILRFGVFVMVDDYYFEGLLRIGEFFDDFYIYNERLLSFIGQKTKRRIHIGSRLHVQLVRVNVKRREIDFTYVGEAAEDGKDIKTAKALLQEQKKKASTKKQKQRRKINTTTQKKRKRKAKQ